MSKDKLEILDFNEETNECLDCGHQSTSFGELYNEQGNKITSWNEEDNVVCPKCQSFNYFLKEKADPLQR